MQNIYISDKQLRILPKWSPDEPFADVPSMQLVIPLPTTTFEGAMSVRRKPLGNKGNNQALMLPRLPMKMIFNGPTPIAVVPFSAGAEWLRSISHDMPVDLEFALMRKACWKLSCRVTRGSCERTHLANRALHAYRNKWPKDSREQSAAQAA